jgi:hypothetical protein
LKPAAGPRPSRDAALRSGNATDRAAFRSGAAAPSTVLGIVAVQLLLLIFHEVVRLSWSRAAALFLFQRLLERLTIRPFSKS